MQEDIHRPTPPIDNGYEQQKKATELAAKIHQGIGARLYEDLNQFRSRLSPDLIEAFETARADVESVGTLEEAQAVLQTLFDKVYEEARAIDSLNPDKDKLLQIAQKVAELKSPKMLAQVIDQTVVQY